MSKVIKFKNCRIKRDSSVGLFVIYSLKGELIETLVDINSASLDLFFMDGTIIIQPSLLEIHGFSVVYTYNKEVIKIASKTESSMFSTNFMLLEFSEDQACFK